MSPTSSAARARLPLPDAPEKGCEGKPEGNEEHRDEHPEPHCRVEPAVGQGKDVGLQEQAPRDPEGDSRHEGEADVPDVAAETVVPKCQLEGGVAEPEPQPIQAERQPLFILNC